MRATRLANMEETKEVIGSPGKVTRIALGRVSVWLLIRKEGPVQSARPFFTREDSKVGVSARCSR
jgi:hypothetical protein